MPTKPIASCWRFLDWRFWSPEERLEREGAERRRTKGEDLWIVPAESV